MGVLNKQGLQVMEVMIALGIFFVVAVGAIVGISYAFDSIQRVQVIGRNRTINQETAAALEEIATVNWNALQTGAYGLSSSTGAWALTPNSDQARPGVTRILTIQDVQRNDDCDVVSAGGEDDPDTKKVLAEYRWNQNGTLHTETFEHLLTRWQAPTYCLAASGAQYIFIDVSQAALDATKKSLIGITAENQGPTDVTIETMTLTWSKPGNLQFITIDNEHHWHSTNGIGSPQGVQPSGTEIDIVDKGIPAGPGIISFDNIRFDAKVDGATFQISATLSDDSVTTTAPFIP